MGRETRLFAFPESWYLLDCVRSGALNADGLQALTGYFGWLRTKSPTTDRMEYFAREDDPARLQIFQEGLELLDRSPDVLWRFADLDRRFEVLLYLLNKVATTDAQREIFRIAISGANPIHPAATATQGAPIMWSDAATIEIIHRELNSHDFGELATHYGTGDFYNQTLYKMTSDRRELTYLHQYYSGFKEFYRSAEKVGHGALVMVD